MDFFSAPLTPRLTLPSLSAAVNHSLLFLECFSPTLMKVTVLVWALRLYALFDVTGVQTVSPWLFSSMG